jgi:hypothetical protein
VSDDCIHVCISLGHYISLAYNFCYIFDHRCVYHSQANQRNMAMSVSATTMTSGCLTVRGRHSVPNSKFSSNAGIRQSRCSLRVRGPLVLQAAAGESIREEASHRGTTAASSNGTLGFEYLTMKCDAMMQLQQLEVIHLAPSMSLSKTFRARPRLRKSTVWIR